MKTKFQLLAVILAAPASLFAQGPLTPPGTPAPTMKTLAQIEARTPISSAPFTITNSGSYYLVSNLTVSAGDAIIIESNNVTLDLNGFTISSTANPASGTAILLNNGRRHVTIFNGRIQGGVTYVAGGGDQFNGPGFFYGISWTTTDPRNARVTDVSVSGCDQHGIHLGSDYSTVVDRCTVRTVGASGIHAGSVSHSTAVECGGVAILAQDASNCYGASTASYGLYATTAANSTGISVTGNGGLYAFVAQNCYGQSSAYGIYATTAQNCYGSASSSSGVGVYTERIAQNCFGVGGIGVYSNGGADSCVGISNGFSGTGLTARTAHHTGVAGPSGIGLRFSEIGAMCVGYAGNSENYILGGGLAGPLNLP